MEANTGRRCRFPQPIWRGAPMPGRTLLLHAEQGLGDTPQFCRFIPAAVAQSQATIILEMQPELRTLLARQMQGIATILSAGDPLPKFDQHCPLPSLSIALATTQATLPAQVPTSKPTPPA